MLNVVDPYVSEVSIDNHLDRIKYAASVCYRSDASEKDSFEFVKWLVDRGHMTPLEHAAVKIPSTLVTDYEYLIYAYMDKKGSDILPRKMLYYSKGENGYLVCNVRAYVEAGLPIELLKAPEIEIPESFITFKLTTDRGIAAEFARHRTASYDDDGYFDGAKSNCMEEPSIVQESTRYVNFNNKQYFICRPVPAFFSYDESSKEYKIWSSSCDVAFRAYAELSATCKPQIARNVLPLSTATTVLMSGFAKQFINMFTLRLAEDAHPQARYIAAKMWELARPVVSVDQKINRDVALYDKQHDDIIKGVEKLKGYKDV